jgi:3-hydroxyisobutyrate dehydrogenase-like beta-hydroxyacid dehydrogenase
MGRPLVDRLVAAGYPVAAFARRQEARDSLTLAGVDLVPDIPALGRDRDITILYPYSDEQVRHLALDDGLIDAMADGSVLVIHTTGNPETATMLAAAASAHGVTVIDAPGSGGPAQVSAGELVLFVGGPTESVERCRPVFSCYAAQIVHFGGAGSGQKVKLINNMLFGAHTELAIEASRLARELGIDPAELASTLHRCSGSSAALDLVSMMGSADALLQGAGWTIYKDVHYALSLMSDVGVPLGAFRSVLESVLERTTPLKRDA